MSIYNKAITTISLTSLISFGLTYPAVSYAGTAGMFRFDTIEDMLLSSAVLIGLVFLLLGLLNLARLSSPKYFNRAEVSVAGVIIYFISGVCLLSVPQVLSIFTHTMIGNTSGLDVLSIDESLRELSFQHTSQLIPAYYIKGIIGFIKLVGLYGIICAFTELKRGADGTKKYIIGRFLGYAIGGAILFNIVQVSCIVANTTGYAGICMANF